MKSKKYVLTCPECGVEFNIGMPQTFCHTCNSPILARYDLAGIMTDLTRDQISSRPRGMWRWFELLPVIDPAFIITLGEGDTPLLRLDNLAGKYDLPDLFIKEEALNPTATFKARGMASAVSRAVELGLHEFVIPTAGNAGGALAFYAGRAGCQAHVYMPHDTPAPIQNEVKMSGADLHLVDGLISDAAHLAAAAAAEHGWFDVSTFKEPYRVEGKKIMGYEIAESLGWELPDVIIYPTGGGTGLVGMWKAFDEMEALGWISTKRPRMVSVQAAGCAPLVRAFQQKQQRVDFWQNAVTIASGLRVPMLFADRLALRCLYQSGGTALSVTDEEILIAQKELAQLEGIWAAPEGAATLAGFKRLQETGFCKPGNKIVLFNTGSGLKYL
jgi:threonine synthase